jgi:hypothetical protein
MLFLLNEFIWIKSDDVEVMPSCTKRAKVVLTSGLISGGFVLNDLSSAPFEMRPCMREKLRKRNIY